MQGERRISAAACLVAAMLALGAGCGPEGRSHNYDGPWTRHAIDDGGRGADGIRLADVNGDGLFDVATGWEKDGVTRAYLHPGSAAARRHWPAVTVGRTPDVEDAVWADLDGDGSFDVVSSCEGATRAVFVSFAPADPGRFLDGESWTTAPIPASLGRQWLYALPMDVDGRGGIDIVVGGKGDGAMIGWLESPGDPRDLDAWVLHRIGPAGWVMSIVGADVNGDGLEDLLVSDHSSSPVHGVRWIERPSDAAALGDPWPDHFIGGRGRSPVFIAPLFGAADAVEGVVVPSGVKRLTLFEPGDGGALVWNARRLPYPKRVGTPKSAAVGDVDLDGTLDVVLAFTNLSGKDEGVVWLPNAVAASRDDDPNTQQLSGAQGEKFDRIELVDIDGDGDLDALTTEEIQNFGVIWYENPLLGGVPVF